MVKRLTRKALSLVVFAAVLLMPFAVTAAIPAKPALNGNLIAGDPVIPADALYGGAPYYIYDKAANTMTVSVQPGTKYYVDFPLDASLTADSSYVISVDVSIPEAARYDAYRGPIFVFRKTTDGKYLGLYVQGGATYIATFTKEANGAFNLASAPGSIDGCLPDGFNGSIKIYSTPNSVRFSVYDANGNPVDLTYSSGAGVIGAEHGWGEAQVKGGEPAFGIVSDAVKVTFSDMLVYSPTVSVEGNLATGAPTIPAAANVYSYDAASGVLSVQGQPGSKYLIDYPLSAELKAKDTYTIAFDYGALARYDAYCGPIVIHRKTTDGQYLGFWFQKSALYHGTFSLGADGQLAHVSLNNINDPLVDGEGGAIVIESAPNKVTLSIVDAKGEPVILTYGAEKHQIGEKHSFEYSNGGDPAFGVTMYGTNTTIGNVVVLSDTIDDNTVEVETPDNGNVAINGDVDVNDMEAGSTVTLTVTPAEGYQIKAGSLAYTVDGKTYPITTRVGDVDGAGNTFAFAMPEGNVSITAEFIDADADNMATLGASYKENDLRFVNRVYRTNARGELKNCGNYLLRADSALGAAFADGAALTEQQKSDLLAAVAAGTAFKVPTTVLNDRCEDYIDFAVRINGAGQDAYKDKAYVCVSYATFDNGDTIYGNACVRSFDGVKNAVSGQ